MRSMMELEADEHAWGQSMPYNANKVTSSEFGTSPPKYTLATSVLSAHWKAPRPRVLRLGPSGGMPTDGSIVFPGLDLQAANSQQYAFSSGFGDPTNGYWESLASLVALGDNVCLAALIEYTAGGIAARIWCDWNDNPINLPPCDQLRVSAVPWGAGWPSLGNLQFQFSASAAVGNQNNAHPPTVSGWMNMVAATPVPVQVPTHAQAFEVFQAGTPSAAILSYEGPVAGFRDPTNGAFSPCWSPVQLPRENPAAVPLTFTSDSAQAWGVRFYLQL